MMQGLGTLLPPNLLFSDSRIQNRVEIVVSWISKSSPDSQTWMIPSTIFVQEYLYTLCGPSR